MADIIDRRAGAEGRAGWVVLDSIAPHAERVGLLLAPCAVGILAVLLYDEVIARLVWGHTGFVGVGLALATLGCVAFAFVRYPAEAEPVRLLLVGLAVYNGLYGLALGTDLGVAATLNPDITRPAIGYAPYLLVAMTGLALLRPSFAIFPALYVALHKDLTRYVGGAEELGVNDYLPLVEINVFLAAGACTLWLVRQLPARTSGRDVASTAAIVLFAAAVGGHLGNYFISGLAKVLLDGGVLSWALENPTSSLMLNGYNLGAAPLSAWPAAFAFVYEGYRAIEIPVNIITLLAQLLCVLAFLHRRLLLGFTVFFDCMHIGIFVLTGALFVPWIVLNSLIVAAALKLQSERLPVVAVVVGILATVVGHTVFYNARLGWYDSRQARVAYFVAVDRDGAEARVPASFLRESSYLLYARHFGYREHAAASDHVPTSAWGQIGILVAPTDEAAPSNYEMMQLGRDCAYPVGQTDALDFDPGRPAAFIAGQHQRALEYADAGRVNAYNLYPHHHFSMPWLYRDFAAMAPEEIVAYRYVTETVCLDVEDGAFKRTVLARTEAPKIEVGRLGQ